MAPDWRRIGAGLPSGSLGRAGIDIAPGTPNVVYLFLDNRAPTTVKDRPYVGGEVYRSDNRGESWRKVNTDDLYEVFGVFGWKFTDIRVDPRNAQHVYILGNRGFESFNGGATWRPIGDRILRLHDTDGRALHLDHHELVIDPANPDRLLLGNDGGLFMSYDGGASWLHLNNIPVSQMYFVATDDARRIEYLPARRTMPRCTDRATPRSTTPCPIRGAVCISIGGRAATAMSRCPTRPTIATCTTSTRTAR